MSISCSKKIKDRIVLVFLALLSIYFLFEVFYLHSGRIGAVYGGGGLILLCALACLVGWGMEAFSKMQEFAFSEMALYVFLALLTILPRLLLMFLIRVAPSSDYAFYYESAAKLAATGVFPVADYNIAVAPNTLTYIGVLGGVFCLFGTSVFTALFFNLVLSTGAVLAFYALARQWMGKNLAVLASAVFALWPNNVLFSLNVASEPLALFFFLWGLYFAVRCFQQTRLLSSGMRGLAAGMLLGLSGCVRSNAVAAVAAAIVYGVLYVVMGEDKKKRLAGLLAVAAILLGYFATDGLWKIIAERVYQSDLGITYGWALYEGLDTKGMGAWTQEGHDALMQVMEAYPPDQVQGQMLKLALEKASHYDAATWFRLIAGKGLNIWVYSDYAYGAILSAQDVEHSLLVLDPNSLWLYSAIGFLQPFLLVLFSVYGIRTMFRGWRRGIQGYIMLLIFPVLGFVVFHSFATSIPRYQYMAVPLLLLSAVCMVKWLGDDLRNSKGKGLFVRSRKEIKE